MKTTTTKSPKSRMPRKVRLLGLLAVAVSAVALVPAGASASTVKADSNLDLRSMNHTSPSYEYLIATITSSQSTCEKNRDFTAFISRDEGGNFHEFASGRASHSYEGAHFSFDDDESLFRVDVARKVVRKHGQKIVCRPGSITAFVN